MLIYTWVASFVWPAMLMFVVYDVLNDAPPRDLLYYVKEREYDEALSLAEFGADKKERALATLSESFNKSDPVRVLPFLHYLCMKCPKQINEEHRLYAFERVAKDGGSVLHMAVHSEAMHTLFENKHSEARHTLSGNGHWRYHSDVLSHVLSDALSDFVFDLLRKGIADIDAVDKNGDSALAVIARRTEIHRVDLFNAALLIENGIDAKLKENAKEIECKREGAYADDFARIIGGEDVKLYLMFRRIYEASNLRRFNDAFGDALKSASDIDATDGFGNTLLHAVVSKLGVRKINADDVKRAVEKVLDKNADKSITDKRGRAAKDIVHQWEAKEDYQVRHKKKILGMLFISSDHTSAE